MRIGITGATGFIGKALIKAALAEGHEIIAYTRSGKASLPGVLEVRKLHVQRETVLDASSLDALVHLAGENVFGLWTAGKKQRIRDSRVQVTNRMVSQFSRSGVCPPIFLCASGSGAYGDRGDDWLTEMSTRGKDFLADVCKEWEAAALRAEALGSRVVLLRTGMVLGPDGGGWPLLRRIFSYGLGSNLGSGRQWTPWIHLDDEVGLILHALRNDACRGAMNLGSPNPVTNDEFTRQIARALRRPAFLPAAPVFALKLVLRDMVNVVLNSQRVRPELAMQTGYTFKYSHLDDALRDLAAS